ncbi:MAG TPA: hypothetical protein VN848_11035 [Gemmatimonadales bacterium]|nr:hypothetical protein [Gemmatimonadales bacterium]
MSDIVFLVPILAVIGFFAWLLTISPVGRAYADRLRQHTGRGPEVGELKASLEDLRRDVAELAERVDFTERLLAERRDPARLEPRDR